MHLTFEDIIDFGNQYCFTIKDGIDEEIFYSVPTSFFVLDKRVPAVLRELFVESEGCLKSNFLTGASACARKIVYELSVNVKAEGDSYEDRIKSLKKMLQIPVYVQEYEYT